VIVGLMFGIEFGLYCFVGFVVIVGLMFGIEL
jgi:hypothetical protein